MTRGIKLASALAIAVAGFAVLLGTSQATTGKGSSKIESRVGEIM